MGGLYARAQGEPEAVATAIYDHYLPLGAEGASPRSLAGAIVSLADKLDSVAAGFSIGNEPTGSSDPFALRRQANAISKVMVEYNMPISIKTLVSYTMDLFPSGPADLLVRVEEFLNERLRFYLETVGGCRYDTARAVLAGPYRDPSDALRRAQAVEQVRDSLDYAALAAAAKRTRNILKKSANAEEYQSGGLEEGLLQDEAEVELYRAYRATFPPAAEAGGEDYRALLTLTAQMRPAIDRFFDKVLVMHPDPAIRKNRLRLLHLLETKVFLRVADLSEIEGHVDASTLPRGHAG